jgi:penicillin-binding protein 2
MVSSETISLGVVRVNTFTMLRLAQTTAVLANNGIKHKAALGDRRTP